MITRGVPASVVRVSRALPAQTQCFLNDSHVHTRFLSRPAPQLREDPFAAYRTPASMSTPSRAPYAASRPPPPPVIPQAGEFKVIAYTTSGSSADAPYLRLQAPAEGSGLETERHFW